MHSSAVWCCEQEAFWGLMCLAQPSAVCLSYCMLALNSAPHTAPAILAVVSRHDIEATAAVLRGLHAMPATVHSVAGKGHAMPQVGAD